MCCIKQLIFIILVIAISVSVKVENPIIIKGGLHNLKDLLLNGKLQPILVWKCKRAFSGNLKSELQKWDWMAKSRMWMKKKGEKETLPICIISMFGPQKGARKARCKIGVHWRFIRIMIVFANKIVKNEAEK